MLRRFSSSRFRAIQASWRCSGFISALVFVRYCRIDHQLSGNTFNCVVFRTQLILLLLFSAALVNQRVCEEAQWSEGAVRSGRHRNNSIAQAESHKPILLCSLETIFALLMRFAMCCSGRLRCSIAYSPGACAFAACG